MLFNIVTITTMYQCSSIMQNIVSYTNSNMCICFRLLFPIKNINLFCLPSGPAFTLFIALYGFSSKCSQYLS